MVEAATRPAWESVAYAAEPKTRLDRAGHTATVVGPKIYVIAGRKRYGRSVSISAFAMWLTYREIAKCSQSNTLIS